MLGLKTDRAGDGDVGIELRFGNSNPRGLRGGFPFGLSHVGPPPQQLGRNSHDDLLRRNGNRAGRLDRLGQLVGRFSHQDAEAVLRRAMAGQQGRNQRLGCPEVRGRLLNVKFRDQALLLPQGHDPERFLLKFDDFSRASSRRSS